MTGVCSILKRGACRAAFGVLALFLDLAGAGWGQQGPGGSAQDDPGKSPPLLQERPEEPQAAAPESGGPSVLRAPQLRARIGFCLLPGFDAGVPSGSRSFSSRALPTSSAEVTVPAGILFVSAAAEYAPTEQIETRSVSLAVGLATTIGERWGAVWDVEASAGALLSDLKVDESRFGEFDAAVGGFARVDLGVELGKGWRASLWAGVRWAEYEFEPTVVSGDRSAGGLMLVGGVSLSVSF